MVDLRDLQLYEIEELMACLGPVSYTHLDVYKRQIRDLSASTAPIWKALMKRVIGLSF